MYSQHPDIAKRWDKEFSIQGGLPGHVKKIAERGLKKAFSYE